MLYLTSFNLPSDHTEIQFIRFENRTCFNTMYPFKIFPDKELERIGEQKGVSPSAVAIAWILRHPAKMQPITGTTNLTRLTDCIRASEITLTREEWYEIYRAAGNVLP